MTSDDDRPRTGGETRDAQYSSGPAWDVVKEIFADASDRPAGDREALLQSRCSDDADLRRAVDDLLKAHDEAGSFFAGAIPPPRPGEAVAAVGQQIARYKLLQLIGEGGFGTVYMAEQEEPVRRRVALKIIKLGMDTKAVIARFEAERQALAMMDHPNIAKVLDAGATDNGRPYFVMELVQGFCITKYCDDQQLTPRQRLALFVLVCQAIQHAHQKGIIHRDLKPSNILVTIYDGKPVPKVIDFGVAKALHQRLTEQTMFTQFGAMVGTLEYMSPEQAEMDSLGTDTRSDVYSLGVLLYELLTGSTPLDSRQLRQVGYAEMLRSIREIEPPKPSTRIGQSGEQLASISIRRQTEPGKLGRLVMGDLDCIVMKALEKDRSRRYETASGFADDVQRYLADEPVAARPASAGYRFRKFARKHRGLFRAVTTMLLLLVFATAFSSWQAIRATQARDLARTRLQAQTEAQNITREQLRLTKQAQDQAMRRLYDARLAQAKASHLSRRVGQRFDSLDAIAEATKIARELNLPQERFLELRNAAIACLALPDLRLGRQWPDWPVGAGHTDFDDSLEIYARTDRQGTVSVRRVADNVETAHLRGSGSESWPLLSRDGRFLSVGCLATTSTVWDLRGAEPVILIQEPGQDLRGIDFSPDSRQCVIGRADGSITLYRLESKQPPRRLPSGRLGRQLAFDPSGRRLAVACDAVVEIRDLDTGKVVMELPHAERINSLAWQPDGQTLAASCTDKQVYLWDVASGKQNFVLSAFANGGIGLAFSHSGGLLASNGWEGMLRLWDPRTGKQLFSTQSNPLTTVPRFSRDDRLLAADFRDGRLAIWEICAEGGEYRTLVRPPTDGNGIYECPGIGVNGRLLAVGMWDGVWLWDLKKGAALGCIKLPGCNQALFEPSGALLTNGTAGLLRWPIQTDASLPANLRIGPPTQLPLSGAICNMACSHDGRVIAVSQFRGGQVLHAEQPDHPILLGPHGDARYVAVSPDGRWVATGSQQGTAIKIWDAQSGILVKELPGGGSRVGFSPDGAWLATTASGLRLWAVGSWQSGPEIGGERFAFSPDSTLVAVESGFGSIRLVDPNTGQEYARLDDPDQDRATLLSFSPDGTQLVATNNDSKSIHLWDLRIIRQELSKLGLDWNLPAYPARSPDDSKALQLHLDLGELDTMIQARSKAENRILGK